jgi:hypothetical protein
MGGRRDGGGSKTFGQKLVGVFRAVWPKSDGSDRSVLPIRDLDQAQQLKRSDKGEPQQSLIQRSLGLTTPPRPDRNIGDAGAKPRPEKLVETRRPAAVSRGEDHSVAALLAAGKKTQFASSRKGTPVDIVIGLDFGTSASKIVIRAPYFAAAAPGAVPVPHSLQAEENPHLWQTVIWLRPSGTFSPVPERGAVAVEGIKIGLMGGSSQPIVAHAGEAAACAHEAAIAYLAYLFRYSRGWLLETKQQVYRSSPLVWHTNVGMPAATYDNPKLVDLYRRTVAAAWLLSLNEADITLQAVQAAFEDKRVIAAVRDKASRGDLGVEVIPEVAAEVVGFARSTRRREGLYVMIDVGAGTLDLCTFRLHSNADGEDRYSMFTADVQLQGAEMLRSFVKNGGTLDQFSLRVRHTMRSVIWHTKMRRDPTAPEWNAELPLFLCGGGRASACHLSVAEGLSPWLAANTQARGAPILPLECPEAFDAKTSPDEFHRLAVAWGLSYPSFDIGELDRPSSIEDMGQKPVRETAREFVSKDLV